MSPHNMITCFPPPCFKGRKEWKCGAKEKKKKKNKRKKRGAKAVGEEQKKKERKRKKKKKEGRTWKEEKKEEEEGRPNVKKKKRGEKFHQRGGKDVIFPGLGWFELKNMIFVGFEDMGLLYICVVF